MQVTNHLSVDLDRRAGDVAEGRDLPPGFVTERLESFAS